MLLERVQRQVKRPYACARGQAMIEIMGSIIIFVVMIALMMSISAYLYLQHGMVSVAREGARFASLSSELGVVATQAAATTDVEDFIINAANQITGQTVTDDQIIVTPPDAGGTTGERTVRVEINYMMTNPVNIAGFLAALGADGSNFESIPVNATATMRYEE